MALRVGGGVKFLVVSISVLNIVRSKVFCRFWEILDEGRQSLIQGLVELR